MKKEVMTTSQKQVRLIKLYNLNYSAHNKNYKMILATVCANMC